MAQDEASYMHQANVLAATAAGRTAPNPMVGAVLVADGEIVGSGFHAAAGQVHAEVAALRQAGERARGATLYVTLEPCDHFGRTPPCTAALIQAGVSRVCTALLDPDPRVSGRGVAKLRAAGIPVDVGLLAEEVAYTNRFYLTSRRLGRPHMLYKYAMTADGQVATHSGSSRQISGPESMNFVHQLRNTLDAVLVGAGTVRQDNPQLTCRLGNGAGRHPLRVVAASDGQIPLDSAILQGPPPGTLVLVTSACTATQRQALQAAGAMVEEVAAGAQGQCLPAAIMGALHRRLCLGVLLEGGPVLARSLWADGLIDEIAAVWAPKVLGAAGRGPFGPGSGPEAMAEATPLTLVRWQQRGEDMWLQAQVRRES